MRKHERPKVVNLSMAAFSAGLWLLAAATPASAESKIRTFDAPAATVTYAYSINNQGAVTGAFVDSNHVQHGFVRASDGTITVLDFPGSAGTTPHSINSKGEIAGTHSDSSGLFHGFF